MTQTNAPGFDKKEREKKKRIKIKRIMLLKPFMNDLFLIF